MTYDSEVLYYIPTDHDPHWLIVNNIKLIHIWCDVVISCNFITTMAITCHIKQGFPKGQVTSTKRQAFQMSFILIQDIANDCLQCASAFDNESSHVNYIFLSTVTRSVSDTPSTLSRFLQRDADAICVMMVFVVSYTIS